MRSNVAHLDCVVGAGTLCAVVFARFVPVLGLLGLCAAPRTARAVDLRPRTPAQFPEVACIEIVDRSADPTFQITYTVAFDDVDRQDDEVADGRTHQFAAFRRQYVALPDWVTRADVEAAEAMERVDETPTESWNVLEESWSDDDWYRITADDARVPITMEQAAMGVEWDTSTVPEGAYVIAAYTWDPSQSLWATRWGVVKVVDGDPSEGPPALRLDRGGDTLMAGTEISIAGCVDAQAGSTIEASWAQVVGSEEPDWQVFLEGEEVETGTLEIPACVPAEAAGGTIRFRVVITDPSGRSYTAYTPTPYNVLAGSDTPACGSGDGSGGSDSDGSGTGCSVSGPGAGWLTLVPLFILGYARRRR